MSIEPSEENGYMDAKEAYCSMLRARGVDDPCEKCAGLGRFNYPNTGTWRVTKGMVVGRGFTMDVCDACWGTGDAKRHGVDLRELEAKVRRAELESVLHYRCVCPEDACECCKGVGAHLYGSGATWRGGIGTASCEWDVCAECWGSGDKHKPWTDLRKVYEVIERLRTESSVRWLAESIGASFETVRPYLKRITAVVAKETRRRKVDGLESGELFWYFRTVEAVAGALDKMASGEQEPVAAEMEVTP